MSIFGFKTAVASRYEIVYFQTPNGRVKECPILDAELQCPPENRGVCQRIAIIGGYSFVWMRVKSNSWQDLKPDGVYRLVFGWM